jgi:hypothetical protein
MSGMERQQDCDFIKPQMVNPVKASFKLPFLSQNFVKLPAEEQAALLLVTHFELATFADYQMSYKRSQDVFEIIT